MVCCPSNGNDVAITVEMQGHYELNVFKPVMAATSYNQRAIRRCLYVFDEHCAQGLNQTTNVLQELVDNSLMLVTALNTKIGYYKSAEIAQTAHKNGTTLKKRFV
jgi:fumarate hydratase class II